MGEKTKIQWTHRIGNDGVVRPGNTFNPIIGCNKVSQGCKFCYAEAQMDTLYGKARWGPNTKRVRTSKTTWDTPVFWNKRAEKSGKREIVFCASLSDVFEDHPDWVQPRKELFVLIEDTPYLDWMLLTKRPENINQMIADATRESSFVWLDRNRHVWMGTSVENQEAANERIPELINVPARIRFLSMEPLLGPVVFDHAWLYQARGGDTGQYPPERMIDMAIVGGESGKNARPMDIEWAIDIKEQCAEYMIPFFMKQLGGRQSHRSEMEDFPEELRIREFPE